MMRDSTTRQRWLGFGVALAVLVALMVVGCEGGAAHTGLQPEATATTIATATVSPPALAGITAASAVTRACQGSGGAPLSVGPAQVGTYDAWQALPDDLPLAPEPVAAARIASVIALRSITVAIPIVATSGASGRVCAVSARIGAYAPLSTPIPNVTRACSDHPYLDPGGPDYGGDCGPTLEPSATANITFASSAAGTTISEPITNTSAAGKPVAFPPAGTQSSEVWVVLSVPASGTYTVVIGLWQSLAGPSLRLVVSDQFVLDAAHEWSGQACALPAMQTKLPAAGSTPVALLCPGAPPPDE